MINNSIKRADEAKGGQPFHFLALRMPASRENAITPISSAATMPVPVV